MNFDKIKNEHLLYLLILVIAAALRLINLGLIPLSEYEASWAMQAFDIAQGNEVVFTGQPAYVIITSFIFNIMGSSTALARLLPALLGSSLVIVPYVFRHHLGRTPALIFALGLALDPGLVAVSRTAGGQMTALGFAFIFPGGTVTEIFPGDWLLDNPVFKSG